jgi:hypothetical protein
LDLGLFIRKPGSFYAGLSTTHLMETELADLSMQPRRHIYAMGGYDHPLDGDYLVLRTNVLAKTDLAATIADINVNVLWDNMLWAGSKLETYGCIAPTFGVEYAMEDKQRNTYRSKFFASDTRTMRPHLNFGTTPQVLMKYS